jgi:hypothetical protein
MTRTETILGGLAAGCAAWLIIMPVLDIIARNPPAFDGTDSVCDREHETRMYTRMQANNVLTVLSGLGCAVASVALLKMNSAKLAYTSSGIATLVGCAGMLYVFHGVTIPCSSDAAWKPWVTEGPSAR